MQPVQILAYTNDFISLVTYILVPVLVSYGINLLIHQIARIKNQAVRDEIYSLVRWAQNKLPDKSVRYEEVAGAVHTRFPNLDQYRVEELIEAAVHDLKAASLPTATVTNVSLTTPSTDVPPTPQTSTTLQIVKSDSNG